MIVGHIGDTSICVAGRCAHFQMPFAEAERNLKCFAKHVLPELKKMETEELDEPSSLEMPAHSQAS